MVIAINILLVITFSFFMYRRLNPALKWQFFSLAILIKFLAGAVLGYLYFNYYGIGDTITYHIHASELANLFRIDFDLFLTHFLYEPFHHYENSPRAWLMVQVTTLFHIMTNNSYWLTSIWFSLFSFAGFYFLCNRIIKIWPGQQIAVTIAFLFFPSVVLWSSGVIKEALAIGAIGFMFGAVLTYLFIDQKKRYLFLAFLFLWLLWLFKYYIAAIWVLVIVPLVIYLKIGHKNRIWAVLSVIMLIAIGVSFAHPNFYPSRILDVIHHNYSVYLELSQSHEAIRYPYEASDPSFLILNAPIALFTALFMPLMFMSSELPYVFAVIENIIIFLLFIGWMFSKEKVAGEKSLKLVKKSLWVYIILLAIFLALSVPNFGTLSRFRISFLPFFIWLILSDNLIIHKFKLKFLNRQIWIRNQ